MNNDDDDNDNKNNSNNKGLRSGEQICPHPLQGYVIGISSLSMLKTICA